MSFRSLLAVGVLLVLTPWASSQPPIPLHSFRVAADFSAPVYGTTAPGEVNNMYVVEQTGRIKVMNVNTGSVSAVFLDIPDAGISFSNGGERGLLGLAFDPNYTSNGRFYVNYTAGDGALTVDRFTASGGVVNLGSRQNIISIPHSNAPNHNAGWTAFGPDGYLYVATGDGGGGDDVDNNAQNVNSLLGKMLRLDVSGAGPGYVSPSTNPFFGPTTGRDEIWAYGLRNPWRNSFDRHGNLYIADVGQGSKEEINFQVANSTGGQNYGWRAWEGKTDNPGSGDPPPPNKVDPFYDYAHLPTNDPFTGFAVVGGYVYRGGDIQEGGGVSLDGTYFFADNVNGRIWSLRYSGTGELFSSDVTIRTNQLLMPINGPHPIEHPSSFAEDSFGRLYIMDLTGGEIFRIQGAAIPEPGTWALIGVAVSGVGVHQWWKRRRRRHVLNA